MLEMFGKIRNFMWEKRIIVRIICSILLIFGISVLIANSKERTDKITGRLIETKSVSPENEGKLIIVSGTPTLANDGVIVDKEMGFQVNNAISYTRMPYQKIYLEEKKEVIYKVKDKDTNKYREEKKIEVTIEKAWVSLNRERKKKLFSGTKVYTNPPVPNNIDYYIARNDMCIGEFIFTPSSKILELAEIKSNRFPKEELDNYANKLGMDLKTVELKNGYYMLKNGDDIGSIKIHFSYDTLVNMKPITIIGRQEGNRIVFDEKNGIEGDEYFQDRIVSKNEYLKSISSEDASSRKIGFNFTMVGIIGILLTISFKNSKFKLKKKINRKK
jgi:hypothetical protein